MPVYRLEEASTGRAGCQNKECKDEGVKISKGELRFGTWVDTERYQSWQWRHWGCVTPRVISHMQEVLGEPGEDGEYDASAVDGFEELSSENQEKVLRALKQGHVEDSEWRGDVEVNRPGKSGFRVKGTPKKKKAADDEQGDVDKEEKKKPAPKSKATTGKRSRKDSDDEEDDDEVEKVSAKKVKKASGDAKQTATKDDAAKAKAGKRGRPRKDAKDTVEDVEEAPKKPRGRKKKSSVAENDDAKGDSVGGDGTDDAEAEAIKPAKKGRKAAAANTADGEKAKRGRPKKKSAAAASDE